MTDTLKAREHYGANSLDITIPSEEVRNYNINPGDIFEFEVESEDGELVLKYKRVYQS
jgi:antitoxin component of MazEF toxin-antitoxin module